MPWTAEIMWNIQRTREGGLEEHNVMEVSAGAKGDQDPGQGHNVQGPGQALSNILRFIFAKISLVVVWTVVSVGPEWMPVSRLLR